MIKRNGLEYTVRRIINMNKCFTQIPNSIFPLINSDSTFRVYVYLLYRYNDEYQYAFPSIKTIAIDCFMSETTVKKAIKELEDFRLIKVQRIKNAKSQYSNNIYYMFYPVINYDKDIKRVEEEYNKELKEMQKEEMELYLEELEKEMNEGNN